MQPEFGPIQIDAINRRALKMLDVRSGKGTVEFQTAGATMPLREENASYLQAWITFTVSFSGGAAYPMSSMGLFLPVAPAMTLIELPLTLLAHIIIASHLIFLSWT